MQAAGEQRARTERGWPLLPTGLGARGGEGEHRACTRQRVRQHGWHRALAPRGRGCRQLSSCVPAAGEQRVGRECGRPLLSAGLGPGAGRASPCAALAARGLGGREGELRGCASSGRAACAEGAGSWRPLGGEAVRGRRGWRVRGFGDAGVAIRVGSVRGGRVVACGARELAAFEQRATSGWRGVWSVMEEERPSYRRGSRATSDRRAPPKRGPPKRSAVEEKRRRGGGLVHKAGVALLKRTWARLQLAKQTAVRSYHKSKRFTVHGSGCFCTRSVLEKGVGLGALKLTHTRG